MSRLTFINPRRVARHVLLLALGLLSLVAIGFKFSEVSVTPPWRLPNSVGLQSLSMRPPGLKTGDEIRSIGLTALRAINENVSAAVTQLIELELDVARDSGPMHALHVFTPNEKSDVFR